MATAYAPRPARPSRAAESWRRPSAAGWSLAAVDTAVTLAEAFVTATLRRWRLTELVDAASAVAVALVRRAVLTTGRPGPLPRHLDTATLRGVGEIKLWVRWEAPHRLRIAVWDKSPREPQARRLDTHLAAVDKESRGRWASYHAHGSGKVIWADIEANG